MSQFSSMVGDFQSSLGSGDGSEEQSIASSLTGFAKAYSKNAILDKRIKDAERKAREDAENQAAIEQETKDQVEAIRLNEVYKGSEWQNIPTQKVTQKPDERIDHGFRKELSPDQASITQVSAGESKATLSNGGLRDQYNLLRAADKVSEEQSNLDVNAENLTEDWEASFEAQKDSPTGIASWPTYYAFQVAEYQKRRYFSNLQRVPKINEALKATPLDLSKLNDSAAQIHQTMITEGQDEHIRDSLRTRGNPSTLTELNNTIEAVSTKKVRTVAGTFQVIKPERVELQQILEFKDQVLFSNSPDDKIYDLLKSDGIFGAENYKKVDILFNRSNGDEWRDLFKMIHTKRNELIRKKNTARDSSIKQDNEKAEGIARGVEAKATVLINKTGVTVRELEILKITLGASQTAFADGKQNILFTSIYTQIQAKIDELSPGASELNFKLNPKEKTKVEEALKEINKITSSAGLVARAEEFLTDSSLRVTKVVAKEYVLRLKQLREIEKTPLNSESEKVASKNKVKSLQIQADNFVAQKDWKGLQRLIDSNFPNVLSGDMEGLNTYLRTAAGIEQVQQIASNSKVINDISKEVVGGKLTLAEADAKVLVEGTSLEDQEKYYKATATLRKEGFENKGQEEGLTIQTAIAEAKNVKELKNIYKKYALNKKLGSKARFGVIKAYNTKINSLTATGVRNTREDAGRRRKQISGEKVALKLVRVSQLKSSKDVKSFLTDQDTNPDKLESDHLTSLIASAQRKLKELEVAEGNINDSKLYTKYNKKILEFSKRPSQTQIKKLLTSINGEKWTPDGTLKNSLVASLKVYKDSGDTWNLTRSQIAQDGENIRNADTVLNLAQSELDLIVSTISTKGSEASLTAVQALELKYKNDDKYVTALMEDPRNTDPTAIFTTAKQEVLSQRSPEELARDDQKNKKEHEDNVTVRDKKEIDIRVGIESYILNYTPESFEFYVNSLSNEGVSIDRQGFSSIKPYLGVDQQVELHSRLEIARTIAGDGRKKPPTESTIQAIMDVTGTIETIINSSTDRQTDINKAIQDLRISFKDGNLKTADFKAFNGQLSKLRNNKITTVTPSFAGESIINDAFKKESGLKADIKAFYYEMRDSVVLRSNIMGYFRVQWTAKAEELNNSNASESDILLAAQNLAHSLITPSPNHPMGEPSNTRLVKHFADWTTLNKGGVPTAGSGTPLPFRKYFNPAVKQIK